MRGFFYALHSASMAITADSPRLRSHSLPACAREKWFSKRMERCSMAQQRFERNFKCGNHFLSLKKQRVMLFRHRRLLHDLRTTHDHLPCS